MYERIVYNTQFLMYERIAYNTQFLMYERIVYNTQFLRYSGHEWLAKLEDCHTIDVPNPYKIF